EPVSAAGEDQRLGARVEERVAQLLEAPRVIAGEKAEMALEDAFAGARLESDVLQRPGASLEALLVERARGSDHRDAVAGAQSGRTGHCAMVVLPHGARTKRVSGALPEAAQERGDGAERPAR